MNIPVLVAAGLAGAYLIFKVAGDDEEDLTRYWPVAPYRGILSGFGVSRDNGARIHAGVDVGAFPGDAIIALDDGEVLYTVTGFGIGAGLLAMAIKHPDAEYIYGEVKSFSVKPGDRVTAGQRIGTAGKNSDGNTMLHLEAWKKAPHGFVPWVPGAMPEGLLNVQERISPP